MCTHAAIAQPMTSDRVAVLIPALNEAPTIARVVTLARRYSCCVLVIDDGSTDSTGDVASQAGAHVLSHKKPRGLGGALQRGLSHLYNRGFSTVVTIDGDGAHDPCLIPGVVEHHLKTRSDLTIGTRLLQGSLRCSFPSPKRAANLFAALLLRRIAEVNLTDVASGMRVLGVKVMHLPRLSYGYGYSFELVCCAVAKGLVVSECPIISRYDARRIFATRRSEILGLLVAATRYAKQRKDKVIMDQVGLEVKAFRKITLRVGTASFCFHPLRQHDSYLIQEQHSFFAGLATGSSIIVI